MQCVLNFSSSLFPQVNRVKKLPHSAVKCLRDRALRQDIKSAITETGEK